MPTFWSMGTGDRLDQPIYRVSGLHNACAGGVVCSVPLNTCGYQYPANGNAYMGIITYSTLQGGLYREVIATELTEPLQPGVPVYCNLAIRCPLVDLGPIQTIQHLGVQRTWLEFLIIYHKPVSHFYSANGRLTCFPITRMLICRGVE